MTVQWPCPPPLEGVKSRERAIFELSDAVPNVPNHSGVVSQECSVARVSLTLQSRVVAIGNAGRSLADVLLGLRTPISGSASCHDDLTVLHIGPHLVDTSGIVAALETRPHVLVLSDAGDDGEWGQIFQEVVHSNELRSFRGALVLCVGQENRNSVPEGLCSTRWIASNGKLHAGSVTIRGNIVDDLCGKAEVDPTYGPLLEQVSELTVANFGEADDSQRGWTVVALTTTNSCGVQELLGCMSYNAELALDALCLQRLAVVPRHRRCGYASQLVQWMIERTKTSDYESLWVHAVPKLQAINTALGFSYMDAADETRPDEEKASAWMMLTRKVGDSTKIEKAQSRKARRKQAKHSLKAR